MTPQNLTHALTLLGEAFQMIAGGEPPRVTCMGAINGKPVIAVTYPGNELLKAMQVEAFVIADKGGTLLNRSQHDPATDTTTLIYFT